MTAEPALAAANAADLAGVDVRDVHEVAPLREVVALLDGIWRPEPGGRAVSLEVLRALAHGGNYVAGAYDRAGGQLLGAAAGFLTLPEPSSAAGPPDPPTTAGPAGPVGPVGPVGLHSHVTGVAAPARPRQVGRALKLHQRAWAHRRGLSAVTWTFDPLVRRNAAFNLAKLAALPTAYLVDFYGPMHDGVNAGESSDRLLVSWDLLAPRVTLACGGVPAYADLDSLRRDGAAVALRSGPDGRPQAAGLCSTPTVLLVQVPADVEVLRQADLPAAREWRAAVRDVLGGLLGEGGVVTGFARGGWYVVAGRERETMAP